MPTVKRRFRGSDPHPPCPDCGASGSVDGATCETCGGIGELGYNEPTKNERKEGMRADTLALLIHAEDISLLGGRVAEALAEENTGDEAATIDVIRRRCDDAGYPDASSG